VAWTNRLQHDDDGQPLLHSVGHDFSERRLAEQALRASQSFLARTGRVAGVGVGGWELDLQTHFWSEEVRPLHDAPGCWRRKHWANATWIWYQPRPPAC